MNTNDPEAIREGIERTRGELSHDVDALGDRMNPSHMAHRRMDQMKSGVTHLKERVKGTTHETKGPAQAADRAREKASSVAQGNPLTMGMVAFGLGLAVASLLPSSRTERRAAVAVEENAGPVEGVKASATEAVNDLREPARESAESVRDTASDAARSLGEHGRDAADDVRKRASDNG